MSLRVKLPRCLCCDVETTDLATVIDPWLGIMYGVCIECVAPMHERQMSRLKMEGTE